MKGTHKIYCLINPITNTPFYVGATKNELHLRLSDHINNGVAHGGMMKRKRALIDKIRNRNKKPIIKLLKNTTIIKVDYYEAFYYRKFKRLGFEMLQSSSRFIYSKIKPRTQTFLKKQ